jgi:hypothetical protein
MKKDRPVAITLALVTVALAALLATEARAAHTYVVAHVASKHGATSDNYQFNEVNPGAALQACTATAITKQQRTPCTSTRP